MDDEEVRARVREGDFSALGDLRLSAREESLVRGVAQEEVDPEVAGFDWGSSNTFAAMSYVRGNMYSSELQGNYVNFASSRYGGVSSALGTGCACPPMPGSMSGPGGAL
jgi:hypothetical protein